MDAQRENQNPSARKKQFPYVAHKHNDHSKWNQFREKRNDVKKEIRYEKAKFYRKALSPNKPKEVWNTINSILNPPPKPISIKPHTKNN